MFAARHHDIGKSEPTFQAMLRGERSVSRFDERPLLAKGNAAWHPDAARRAGLPKHWRHEVLSTVMATNLTTNFGSDDRDLALWLIATHHGHGRFTFAEAAPTMSTTGWVSVRDVQIERPAGVTPSMVLTEHTTRGRRLESRFGAWGLAWLEALLRLADHRASAQPGHPEMT
jgi:CRISPR-associated endonuclease/helicase Cas3